MQLLVENERGEATTHDLSASRTRIGRAPSCEIVLADHTVSRLHATIDLVGEHHALEDQGSANGTFLNGLRLPRRCSFVLRPGDRIEIAHARFTYGGRESSPGESSAFDAVDLSCSIEDLVASAPADDGIAARTFARELAAVSPVRGLEACLEYVRECLVVDTVAIFVPRDACGVETYAAVPSLARAASLAEVARSIMASDRGRIVRQLASSSPHGDATSADTLVTAAVVPLLEGSRPLGVLAVERRLGRRLVRAELAKLAVLAARLGEALARQCPGDQDTRLGLAG